MAHDPHAEFILLRTRHSGSDELYAADSLQEIREFIDLKAGRHGADAAERLATEGGGADGD